MVGFLLTIFGFLRGVVRGFRNPESKGLFFSVLILLISGTVFYAAVEKWSVIDSLFFSVTTLTTVGYGNLVPETTVGKVFTIIYILVGLGLIAGFVNVVGSQAIKRKNSDEKKSP